MTERISLKDAAYGRWRGILLSLGFTERTLSGRHGPCPICGEGKDRFRFDDQGRGTWICSQCGAGDGASLVMKTRNIDFKAAAALIEPLVDSVPFQAPRAAADPTEQKRWLNDLWNASKPIEPVDPAGRHLRARVGLSAYPACLRFNPSVTYADGDAKTVLPAMVAKVVDADGKPVNLHRTYLTPDGEKAPVPQPRKIMPGQIPDGSAIRLARPTDVLGIAEGIETALAASSLFSVPCWAAINAPILSKWSPPSGVRKVIVFADNDANFAGQHAAFQLANRLTVKAKVEAEVRIPDRAGNDWNDILMIRSPS